MLFATVSLGASTLRSVPTVARLAANWQISQLTEAAKLGAPETGWVQATFYLGLARWAEYSRDESYFDLIRDIGRRNKWQLGSRTYNADDQLVGQVYAIVSDHFRDPLMIEPMTQRFDFILAHKPMVALTFDKGERCQERWCWSDALFMAPATWFALSRLNGDRRYRDYADAEFWATKSFLFDRNEHLFYRDSRFFGQKGVYGERIFWGRGNGWVFAALVNILRELPSNDRSRRRYEALLREMAGKLITRQRADGFWTTSLMSPLKSGTSESSCTAFFTYGLAAGVNMGLLDRQQFGAAALRGWQALTGVISAGRLGRVQKIGDQPADVDLNDTQAYGSGALLLAASAVDFMEKVTH